MHKVIEVKREGKKINILTIIKEDISLEYMQRVVKGYIQPITYPNGVILWVNENSFYHFENEPITLILKNMLACETAYLKGDLLFTASKGDDIVGLNKKQLKWVKDNLKDLNIITGSGHVVYEMKDPSYFL